MRTLTRADVEAIADAVAARLTAAGVGVAKPLNTSEAAAYCGFRTASAIRHCMSRGELVPDGAGAHNVWLFRRATLDAFLLARGRRRDQRVGTPPDSAPTRRGRPR